MLLAQVRRRGTGGRLRRVPYDDARHPADDPVMPVLIVFFLAQRVFIQGVTLTGVKG
jgi:hypothetical protein